MNLDWENLGFAYRPTDYRYVSLYKNGAWDEGTLSSDPNVVLNESACVLQYAQCCFEGLKAYSTEDGRVVSFRPDMNAQRMGDSCRRMEMPVFPEERFVDAVRQTVHANRKWVPPYGSGASLYLRPYLFGSSPVIGVHSAEEFQFRIFATPVGPYFKGGIRPLVIRVCDLDRAAPRGTGHIKASLNYAMSLYALTEAHALGYDENLYLDSATRTYVEETGGANLIFAEGTNKLVVPMSSTILPSITRRSLTYIAREYLGLEVEERQVALKELDQFTECGLCGTAAVISPVGKIVDHGKDINFAGMGPVIQKLYDTLTGIQMGRLPAPEGWLMEID
ncbi:MAG: branched-chain amino acid aminotransferase [Candidatus Faecousia sp.]|nr:branched-chain amino acid aminotransferase [Candidatus Faecousia sp.]